MDTFECPFSLYRRKTPKHLALISESKIWTYEECEKLIQGSISFLKKEGIKAGDPVAILPTKDFRTPLLFFALFRLGAIACPINTYHPLDTLSQKLDKLKTSCLLYPDETILPRVKQNTLPFSRIIQEGRESGQTFLEKNNRATYLFTSGTTADPKIACHSLGNHYYSALGSNSYMPISAGDRYFLSLPLYHIAGIALLFRTFLAGGTVALSDEVPGITHLSLIPTQLQRMLKEKKLPTYKHILLGGAQISPALIFEGRKRGLPLHPTYGMTEMSSQITTLFDPSYFSLGHPLPFREIKLGGDGEILVKGKTLFQGYLKEDHLLDLPINEEGYFPTKDLGTYSPKTGLQLLGRKDRLFISGGENIHPEEIEKLLKNIEGIIRAKVVPIPDEEFGYRPTAYIESEKSYRDEELKEYLSALLPKFKIPVKFFDATDIPRTHKE